MKPKIFRLKEDTIFHVKNTLAIQDENIETLYDIYTPNEGYRYCTVLRVQIEDNSLWEEITEDQREEEIKLPIGGEPFFTIDIYGNIERKFWNADDSLNIQFRKIFKAGNAFKTRKEAEVELEQRMGLRRRPYYCELPTSNSQALREESLKVLEGGMIWDRPHPFPHLAKKRGVNPNTVDVILRVDEKYAYAWRSLLDKKEE